MRPRVLAVLATLSLAVPASEAPALAQAPLAPSAPAADVAQSTAPSSSATEPVAPAEAADSPRASARTFLDLTQYKGDFAAAARYLTLPRDQVHRGPELARRLRDVVRQSLVLDLDKLSPLSGGDPSDGLPEGVDRAGSIASADGRSLPLYVVRTADAKGTFWALSRETVGHIDAWYDALPDRWVRDWMPESLQREGPFDLLWWQWLALPLVALVAFALGRVLGHTLVVLLGRLFARTTTDWDDRLLERTEPALRLLVAVVAAAVLLPLLVLLPAALQFLRKLLDTAVVAAVFWGLWLSVDVWRLFLMGRPWAIDNASARSLLSVGINFLKLIVAVAGILAVLAVLGYPVATVLAGLGIGGIAIAFGAQKTIENLFGSIALAVDQPFRVGDFVRIEDAFMGNVEQIGMRSTQIRTLDRTVVTLPNGKLSEMRIEGFGTRDRIRFNTLVGLVYGTTEAQMRQVGLEIERLLRSRPDVWPDTIIVRFSALGSSSLDVEVMCWFLTSDFNEFRRMREEALLGILGVVEAAGTSVAFPTRTVHLAKD